MKCCLVDINAEHNCNKIKTNFSNALRWHGDVRFLVCVFFNAFLNIVNLFELKEQSQLDFFLLFSILTFLQSFSWNKLPNKMNSNEMCETCDKSSTKQLGREYCIETLPCSKHLNDASEIYRPQQLTGQSENSCKCIHSYISIENVNNSTSIRSYSRCMF